MTLSSLFKFRGSRTTPSFLGGLSSSARIGVQWMLWCALAVQLHAATPTLSVSATTVSFGNVNIGQTATHSITLSSTGKSPVTISSISVAGSLFGAVGVSTPVTLNPGQRVILTATFTPRVANPWNYT